MYLWAGDDADAMVEKWKESSVGQYVSHREMPISAIPIDRTFRGAWSDETPELVVDVDMAKARSIVRDGIRVARAPRLAELDTASLRAMESDNVDEVKRIAAEKQVLRDAPADPAIDKAETPEQLRAMWPAALS